MTHEEASKIIYKQWQEFLEKNIDYAGVSEAYKMAIKALEQEPSGDAVSRQAVLDAFADYVGSGMSMNDFDALWDIVLKAPSVNPQKNIVNNGTMNITL